MFWNLWISNVEATNFNVVLLNARPIFSLSLVLWRSWLYWNINSKTCNSKQLTSRNKIFFSVNVGAFMGSIVRKWKWGSSMSNIVCCSAVCIHYTEQHVKVHEHHYLTYIQMLQKIWRKPIQFLCTNLHNMTFTHNLWYGDICFTINKSIDVKFPEGSFESQQFATADGGTRSLRFVRPVTFSFQKNIVITLDFFLPETWNTNS